MSINKIIFFYESASDRCYTHDQELAESQMKKFSFFFLI